MERSRLRRRTMPHVRLGRVCDYSHIVIDDDGAKFSFPAFVARKSTHLLVSFLPFRRREPRLQLPCITRAGGAGLGIRHMPIQEVESCDGPPGLGPVQGLENRPPDVIPICGDKFSVLWLLFWEARWQRPQSEQNPSRHKRRDWTGDESSQRSRRPARLALLHSEGSARE
jgi:hypothetical protein